MAVGFKEFNPIVSDSPRGSPVLGDPTGGFHVKLDCGLRGPIRVLILGVAASMSRTQNFLKTIGFGAILQGGCLVCAAILMLLGCSRQPRLDPVRIQVTAHRYAFDPAIIHVKKGQDVTLEISTTDVQHGFAIKELRIDESVQKGRPAVVTFRPSQPGEYKVECSILCGPRHDQMRAKLVVE